jgi:iron complex outermembrane receptor protein
VAKRFFTHTNALDAEGDDLGSVPSYTLFDGSVGYELEAPQRVLGARSVSIRVNGKNLLDETYIATIGTNGFTTMGDNQTLQTGPGRLVYVTVGVRF